MGSSCWVQDDGGAPGFSLIGRFQVDGATYRDPLDSATDLESEARTRLPVTHVSREDAIAYCAGRGARLPTQEEWEYAARGPERRIFPWGDEADLDQIVPPDKLSIVGSVGANGAAWRGHQDMAGNVWEWTSSKQEGLFVLRGGSFADTNPARLRGAVRERVEGSHTNWDVGFRCVDLERDSR